QVVPSMCLLHLIKPLLVSFFSLDESDWCRTRISRRARDRSDDSVAMIWRIVPDTYSARFVWVSLQEIVEHVEETVIIDDQAKTLIFRQQLIGDDFGH